ncbi:Rho1 guanine nucleotide exchange factor 1 [Cucumispora dikerogammari]|nr:Rho1 guanine nucleotide exchange factor 1 [Cucumispora dikerogammari]
MNQKTRGNNRQRVTFNLPEKARHKHHMKEEGSSSSEKLCLLDTNVSKRLESSIQSDTRKSMKMKAAVEPPNFPKNIEFKSFAKRIKALGECFESEKVYFKDLITWGHEFKSKLLDSECLSLKRKTDLCNAIFTGFDVIIDLHGELIEHMIDENQRVFKRKGAERFNSINLLDLEKMKYEKTDTLPGFKDLLTLNYTEIYIKYLPLFYNYLDYVRGLPKAEYELDNEYSKNPRFKKVIEDFFEEYNVKNLGIKHFLYRPSQKLNRYAMLFRAIYKVETAEIFRKQIEYSMIELGKVNKLVDVTFGLINQQFECFKLSKGLKYHKNVNDRYPLNLLLKSQKIIKRGDILVETSDINNNIISPPMPVEIIILTDMIILCSVSSEDFDKTRTIMYSPLHLLKCALIDKSLNPLQNTTLKKYTPLILVEKGLNNITTLLFNDPITKNVYKKIIIKQIDVLESKLDKNLLLVECSKIPNMEDDNNYSKVIMERIQDYVENFDENIEEHAIDTELGVSDTLDVDYSSQDEDETYHNSSSTCGCKYMKTNVFSNHIVSSSVELFETDDETRDFDAELSSERLFSKYDLEHISDCCKNRVTNMSSQDIIGSFLADEKIVLKNKSFIKSFVTTDDNADRISYSEPYTTRDLNNEQPIISHMLEVPKKLELAKKNENEKNTAKMNNQRTNEKTKVKKTSGDILYSNDIVKQTQEKILDIIASYANKADGTITAAKKNILILKKPEYLKHSTSLKNSSPVMTAEPSLSKNIIPQASSEAKEKKKSDVSVSLSFKGFAVSKRQDTFTPSENEVFEKVFLNTRGKDLTVRDMNNKFIKNIKIDFNLTKKLILLASNNGLFMLIKRIPPYEKDPNKQKQVDGEKIRLFEGPVDNMYYNSIYSVLIFLSKRSLYISKFNHFSRSITPQLIVEDCENFFFNCLDFSLAVIKRAEVYIISVYLYNIIMKRNEIEIKNGDIHKEVEKTELKTYPFYKKVKVFYKRALYLENITFSVNLQHKLFVGAHVEAVFFTRNLLIIGGASFETINPYTLKARDFIDPLDLIIPYYFGTLETVLCKKLFLVDNKYLIIYDQLGFFVNKHGSTVGKHIIFNWVSKLEDCYIVTAAQLMKISRKPKSCIYQNILFVISKYSYEIWNLENGQILNFSIKKDLKFVRNLSTPILHDNKSIYALKLEN